MQLEIVIQPMFFTYNSLLRMYVYDTSVIKK